MSSTSSIKKQRDWWEIYIKQEVLVVCNNKLQGWRDCALSSVVFLKIQQDNLDRLHLYIQVSIYFCVDWIKCRFCSSVRTAYVISVARCLLCRMILLYNMEAILPPCYTLNHWILTVDYLCACCFGSSFMYVCVSQVLRPCEKLVFIYDSVGSYYKSLQSALRYNYKPWNTSVCVSVCIILVSTGNS